MNKKLIAMAIAAGFAVPMSVNAAPTLYGHLITKLMVFVTKLATEMLMVVLFKTVLMLSRPMLVLTITNVVVWASRVQKTWVAA